MWGASGLWGITKVGILQTKRGRKPRKRWGGRKRRKEGRNKKEGEMKETKGGHEQREKTHLKVKCGVVGGECSVQLWVYLQRGGETTTTRDGCCRRGGRGKMAWEKRREMV